MKLTIPGIVMTALIVVAPVAFAQNTGYSGTSSNPGASVTKDDTNPAKKMTKHSKKHTASYKQRHHAKAMNSKAQTTGSGSTSAPGASINKDDTTAKPRQ